MSYLYGDSTPSKLEVNYIEFLRDAVECCVQLLLADQRIAEAATRTRALEAATATEIARLQKLGALVPKAFEGTAVGDSASPTARCLAAIVRSAADIVRAAVGEAEANLAAATERRDAEAAVERELFVKAIEALLIKHDLPDMASDMQVSLLGGTRYACRMHVVTAFGLDATFELGVPEGHLFERVVRVDRLAERLDVQVPEMAGWVHKEVKLRAHHLDKLHLTAFSSGPAGSTLQLRLAPEGTGPGYDLTFAEDGSRIRLVRVDEQQQREEAFDAQEADVPKLQALRDRVAAAASELARQRTKIVGAKLDGESLQSHSRPTLLVERLIALLIPETREIAARSQSPGELVLRRSLGGDRREEIFLARQELTQRLEPLSERNRALFDSLLPDDGAAPGRGAPPAPPPRPAPAARPPTEGPPPLPRRRTPTPPTSAAGMAGEALHPESADKATATTTPASPAAPSISGSRLPTPRYGVTPFIASAKPTSGGEPAPARPAGGEAPPRRTATFELPVPEQPPAAALDRPPPASVAGEIGQPLGEKSDQQPGAPSVPAGDLSTHH